MACTSYTQTQKIEARSIKFKISFCLHSWMLGKTYLKKTKQNKNIWNIIYGTLYPPIGSASQYSILDYLKYKHIELWC